ncbi:MAG: hypothetical protein HKN93_07440 [Acidimicrobiia bacterium]|nr:hypothetical protein [Acidimicrobiia bacterium]
MTDPYPILRPTARVRPQVRPVEWPGEGFLPEDPYVRRYWTATVGAGAVAELIKSAVAARRGLAVKVPLNLAVLVAEGLMTTRGGRLAVRNRIPSLNGNQFRRLPASIRREHDEAGYSTCQGTASPVWTSHSAA